MVNLNELEALAKTDIASSMVSYLDGQGETILRLIELVREQHEALLWVHSRFADVSAKALLHEPITKYKELTK